MLRGDLWRIEVCDDLFDRLCEDMSLDDIDAFMAIVRSGESLYQSFRLFYGDV